MELMKEVSQSWLTILLPPLLLLATTLFFHYRNHHSTKKFPPGPKPWPIIGNLHQIGPIPHCSFHTLSNIYGPLLHLRFGSRPVVVASNAHMAEQFLKTYDHIFASRPTLTAGKYLAYNYSDMTFAPYGPHWRQAKKIYLSEIFNPKKLESYDYILEEEKQLFIRRLYKIGGESIKLREELTRYSLLSINRMVMGNKYFDSIMKIEDFQKMLDEWFFLGGAIMLGDWIPWVGFLDLHGYVNRMKGLSKKFVRFYNHIINDHKNATDGDNNGCSVKEDMVDVLLKLANDPNLEIQLTSDRVNGLIQDLLSGGTDTSATTVEWAILELLKHPNILKKATEELDKVVGNKRWVQEKDFPQLQYIESIIKETLRLHPLVTLLAPHFAMEDCKINGYDILKGTTVFINTWSLGRDPRYWDEPEAFKPERFLGENAGIDITGKNFELLPFGSGRRRCPGYKLGLNVIRSTLANLLHGFVLRLPNDMKAEDICMEELYGLTTHPKVSLRLFLDPKLTADLY